MATIRHASSRTVVDVMGAASAAATTLTDTTRAIGRFAQAGYAWSDAWASDVESNAAAKKIVAGAHAEDKAIAWLVEQETAIMDQLDSEIKQNRFNLLKEKHFPK